MLSKRWTSLMRRFTLLGGASVMAAALLVALAPPSSASFHPYCPRGAFCVMDGGPGDWPKMIETRDWEGAMSMDAVVNHGRPQPGADHIQITYTDSGQTHTMCLHRHPHEEDFVWFNRNLPPDHPDPILRKVEWRGECEF